MLFDPDVKVESVGEMEEGIKPVPAATYNLRSKEADWVGTPKKGSNPYINVKFVITGPGDTEYIGRYVFDRLFLSGKAAFRTRNLLEVTNHPPDFKPSDTDEFVGLECAASIGIEKHPDHPDKNVVKKYLPLIDDSDVDTDDD